MNTVQLCELPPQVPTRAVLHPNTARNHHYIAQTEQRLYAFNPEVNANNQNVYRHAKAAQTVRGSRGQSVNIDHNLSAQDLYTLAELRDGQQYNLEPWFVRYEGRYEVDAEALHTLPVGTQALPETVVRVLKLKWLSLLRNPYNAQHFMLRHLSLAWQQGLEKFAQELQPHLHERDDQARFRLAKQFGFTDKAYVSWLSFLYALLSDAVANPSWLERLTDSLIRHPAVRIELFQDRERAYHTVFADTGFALQAASQGLSIGFGIDSHHWLICHIPEAHWQNLAQCWCEPASAVGAQTLKVLAADASQAQIFNALMYKNAEHHVYAQVEAGARIT